MIRRPGSRSKPMQHPEAEARQRAGARVTMTDIAREAGCSQTTVSFVLNQTPGITLTEGTRRRVLDAAQRLGYIRNGQGSSEPASPPSNGTVGFVVDQLATSPEAVVAIDGARQACWPHKQVLLVGQTLNDPEMEPRTIRTLVDQGISGLVYMTIFTREIVLPDILMDIDVPVVLQNCYTTDRGLPSVVPNELVGGQRSTRHLIEQGHRRIATITGEIWMEAAQDRLKGYRMALATADIPFDPDLVVEGDWSAGAGHAATRQLLDLAEPPTAIWCQNDRTAIGCYEALKEAGVSIPADMSVMGYDDEEIAQHLHPPLTTSILPHRAMGQWAIETLTGLPPEPDARYPVTRLDCNLVERQSVGPPTGVRRAAARSTPGSGVRTRS